MWLPQQEVWAMARLNNLADQETSSSQGSEMNIARTTVSLVLLAALGATAQAQSEKTRDQVKAELAEAIRTGDVLASGESGLKLNELYPQRYPHAPAAVATTRAQVKAELAEAIRTGDMIASGESGLKLNEEFPQRYAKARGLYASQAQQSTSAAASTVAH